MLSHHEQKRARSVWICEHEIHIIDANLIKNFQWKNQSDIKIFSRKQPLLYPLIHNLHFDQAYDHINICTQEPINLPQPNSQRRFWKYKITEDLNTHRIPFQNLISVLRERGWDYVHRSQPIILPQPHCSHTPCCSSSSTQLQNANIEPRWVKKHRFKHHGFQKANIQKGHPSLISLMKHMLGHILVTFGGSRKEGIAGNIITGNTMPTFFQS